MISSVTCLVSVTGFFFITTSSFTYGVFETSTSSLFNGISISSLEVTGSCVVDVLPVGCLRPIDTSSCVTGTSIVLVSVIGSLVIVVCCS